MKTPQYFDQENYFKFCLK